MFIRFFFLLAFVSSTTFSALAKVNVDSLWQVWHTPEIPSLDRQTALYKALNAKKNISPIDSIQKWTDILFEAAERDNHIGIMANTKNLQGIVYARNRMDEQAILSFTKAGEIERQRSNKKGVAQSLNNLGLVYKGKGNFNQALTYFQKSLRLREEIKDSAGIAGNLNNIGLIYRHTNDLKESLSYLHQALDIKRKLGLDASTASTLVNIGNIYSMVKDYDHALTVYKQALIPAEKYDLMRTEANALIGLGIIYKERQEYDTALYYYTSALEIPNSKNDPSFYSAIGTIYYLQGKLDEAMVHALRAHELAEKTNNLSSIQFSSDLLHNIYRKLNQHEKALEKYKQYILYRDSIDRLENQKAAIEFQFQEKALKDSLTFLQKQNQTELDHQSQLTNRNYLWIGILGLAGLFFLFFRYRQQLRLQQEQAEQVRLAELDAVKTRLYTNITHEFRTPLTVIQGMAKKVLEKPDKWLQQGTGMIERNSVQLLNLVNQMLDLSKLESGKLQLQTIQADIIPFLYYVAEPFQAMAESKGISLHIQQDVDKLTMDFDPDRLTEIISNLLSNAIKFTPAGGQIDMQALSDKDSFMLIIRDTGIGISQDKLPHIFDRFYQADDSPTRSNEGTGIGLALSKELVQLMGGRIQVSSQPGEGTEFTITLPISQQAIVADLPMIESNKEDMLSPVLPNLIPSQDQVSPDLPHILLIEDNADVVSYLSTCLEANYRISIARNGQEGIDKALELVPDLIISDVMMPEKDGFEVCYTLKQDIRTSHVPIIMLTAKADVESKLTGLRRGADAYLSKPFHEEELLIRIHNLLEVRNTLQSRYRSASHDMDAPSTADMEKEDVFIQTVRQVIMAQLSNYQLDVPTLCKELGMTRTPLHNKLKALTGMSTTEFVRYVRLTHAQELLRDTDMHVSEVAYATGFQNHTYFSRKFREVFGQTPKGWREET